MSNIQNTPVCNEPYVQKVRGAMQHRAQWLHLILDEARKQGIELESAARAAMARCGCFQGAGLYEDWADHDSLRSFAEVFADEDFMKFFDMEIVEATDSQLKLRFHHCPLVAGWQAIGCSDEEVARLRDKLEQGLLAAIPDCMVNGDPENRLPNTTNIAFKNVEGEAILLMLDQLGICASSGSACTSGSLEPSHVLRAMGVPFTYAHGSVRLSLSRYTTEEEIDFVVENMPQVIKTLRAISPFKN